MRLGIPWLVAAWLLGVGQLDAQTSAPAEPPADSKASVKPKDDATAPTGPPLVDLAALPDDRPGYRLWAQVDYLLWWVRSAPVTAPLVTTGDPNVGFNANLANTVNTAGAIGQPGTRVLLGQGNLGFPGASGTRFTLGGWIDPDQRLGLEGSGFVLAQAANRFTATSNGSGSPPLYFPIFSGIAGAERAIPIADPLRGFSGDVAVTSTMQLWGAEGNALCMVYRTTNTTLSLLAGIRYADLRESLLIHNSTKDLLFGNTAILNDSFRTVNQFYGAQLGSRLSVQLDRFSLDVTGKFAIGSAHQYVDIEGNITQVGPNPLVPPGLGIFPGGLFAQPSNIGMHDANPLFVPFMVLPSLDVQLAYQLTSRLRAVAGYQFLYWNQVLRPGTQISHQVNLSQNAVLDPSGVGTLVGAAVPTAILNRSDFWAQGVSLGLEYRY